MQDRHQIGHHDLLARLPDGVLVQIFEAVGRFSKRDLCQVSRLSHRYHILADAVLYKTVHFLTPELHLIFGESLRRRPRRGSAIQEVKLAYPASQLSDLMPEAEAEHANGNECSNGHANGTTTGSGTNGNGNANGNGTLKKVRDSSPVDSISRTISRMSNLETLDIAVPNTLLHGIGLLFNGPFDLACLETCTLFYQTEGDEYWDLYENIHIFAQPTLKTLVIKRAKLDHRGFDLIERPEETALQRLHLLDCDINDESLSDLLSFPKDLKEFVMTQAANPSPDLEESSDSIRDYMIALNSACHSLETITIDFPMLQSSRALALRDFECLKTLRLNWDYQLFGKSSKKPRMTSVGMPPELETLEFFNQLGTDEEVTDLLVNMVENIHITARNLKRLIVTEREGEDRIPKAVEDACNKQPQLQLDIIGRAEAVCDTASSFKAVNY